MPTENLAQLTTEQRNPNTTHLDTLRGEDLVRLLHTENTAVLTAVEAILPQIGAAVEAAADRLRSGGRMLYLGAGTSGRLGVLDASECPPTFGVPPNLIHGIIAGGDTALRTAVEGAEDDSQLGARDVDTHQIGPRDVVVGIAASGRTPYVLGGMQRAKELQALTISVTNVSHSALSACAHFALEAVTGPEPLTGSTRLKAGTAQKIILNLLSTGVMVRLGKVYENLMVDVQATNHKLRGRAVRITREVTGCTAETAETTLAGCQWKVRTACVMIRRQVDAATAETILAQCGGSLRAAMAAQP
jgi:N-acetylmuramic acid 6-phosphate etherase